MPTAKQYLDTLRQREPQLWDGPPEPSPLGEKDLAEIERGLGYPLPEPYRDFLQSCKMPEDLTVLVSVCGDSFGCSWPRTYSRETGGYLPRPDEDIGPTVEFAWHNIAGNTGAEFLATLQREQKTEEECPCFLEAGFLLLGDLYGHLTYLDLVKGGIVTIHEEGVYDMMIVGGVHWDSRSEVRDYMEGNCLYICNDFNDFLRFVCTGDFLDEDEARFPTPEELEEGY